MAISSSLAPLPSTETVARTTANLFQICQGLQNSDFYSAEWADACVFVDNKQQIGGTLVASRNIEPGEVLSLYPLHAIGLQFADDEETMLLFDDELDGKQFSDYNAPARDLMYRHSISLLDEMTYPYPPFLSRRNILSIDVNPTRPLLPGWLGHLAKKQTNSASPNVASNCIVVPLAGTAPLCALVSTSYISQGQGLVRKDDEAIKTINKYAQSTAERYYSENIQLRSYLNLAYHEHVDHTNHSAAAAAAAVYAINREYPGLEVLYSSPDVLVVENFLTADECDRLVQKAKPHLVPCFIKSDKSGNVQVDLDRTSFNTNVPKMEVPSIVSKIVDLTNVNERQLEILQVLRYTRGQHFVPHTDGFSGPISACGFQHSGRLVTIFVYLNDVKQGGQTRFTQIGLEVTPRKGMAVLHFPAYLDLQQDERTEHEGVAAVDDKWLLVTWVWKNFRTDQRYGELHDPPLSQNDII